VNRCIGHQSSALREKSTRFIKGFPVEAAITMGLSRHIILLSGGGVAQKIPPQAFCLPATEPRHLVASFRAPQSQLSKQFLSIKPDSFFSPSAKFASD
jgi:hypothetical protein